MAGVFASVIREAKYATTAATRTNDTQSAQLARVGGSLLFLCMTCNVMADSRKTSGT
jgi:hypothetical protein